MRRVMGLDDWDTEMTEPGGQKRGTEDRVVSITRRRIDVPVTPPGAGPYRTFQAPPTPPGAGPYAGYARNAAHAAYPPSIRVNENVPRLPHAVCLAEDMADQDMGAFTTSLSAVTNENKKKHIRGTRHDEF